MDELLERVKSLEEENERLKSAVDSLHRENEELKQCIIAYSVMMAHEEGVMEPLF